MSDSAGPEFAAFHELAQLVHSLAEELAGSDGAQVEIVPGEVPIDAFVGDFGKSAEMLAGTAGDKHRRLVQSEIVVSAQMFWGRILGLGAVRERGDRHRRERDG